jgi:hypothetical protein
MLPGEGYDIFWVQNAWTGDEADALFTVGARGMCARDALRVSVAPSGLASVVGTTLWCDAHSRLLTACAEEG